MVWKDGKDLIYKVSSVIFSKIFLDWPQKRVWWPKIGAAGRKLHFITILSVFSYYFLFVLLQSSSKSSQCIKEFGFSRILNILSLWTLLKDVSQIREKVIMETLGVHLGLAQHCLAQHWLPNNTVFNWFQKSSHSTVFSHFYHS